jgi:Squalene-hopene cyclase N-terminal domain
VLADLTKWLTEAGEGRTGVPRPAALPKALNSKAVYYALGLNSVPDLTSSQRDALKLLLRTVTSDQTDNGSWASWPETRPPFFGNSDESMTALATLALLPEAANEDGSAKTAVDKSVRWLERTRSDDDPQSVAMRLVLYAQLRRPRPEWLPLVRRIQKRQRRDGGWSQTVDGPSDAWATGQALYALSHAGTASDKRALARGRAFLVNTQREDGSWPMTSRPQKPGGKGADNLVPITGGGSAWAVLGLTRSEGGPGTLIRASAPFR